MAGFVVPTFNGGTYEYNIALNGITYFIRTYYNEYASMWFLDLLDSNNDPIAYGLALVPDINILSYREEFSTTIGELRIADTNGDGNELTASLGDTSLLYYFRPGEFEETYPAYNPPVTIH